MMSTVPSNGTVVCGSGAVVARLLAKEKVAGSTPVFRSHLFVPSYWGYTGDCQERTDHPRGRQSG